MLKLSEIRTLGQARADATGQVHYAVKCSQGGYDLILEGKFRDSGKEAIDVFYPKA